MELDDDGLPLQEDATVQAAAAALPRGQPLRRRRPGSPGAPVVDSDYIFPPQQTSNTVQLDEVLTGVSRPTPRATCRSSSTSSATALIDEGGAESLQELNRASPGAFKYTSQVNQALLGENPHDLSELIANLDRVVRGLGRNEPPCRT